MVDARCDSFYQGLRNRLGGALALMLMLSEKYSSIRSLVFQSGGVDNVIATIDISVAFLQADKYPEGTKPRYVSLRAYRGSTKHVFQLLGPVYGQRSISPAFYITLRVWLVGDMKYVQAENDPCAFRHRPQSSDMG